MLVIRLVASFFAIIIVGAAIAQRRGLAHRFAGVVMSFSIIMMMLLFSKEQRGTAMDPSSIVIGLAPAIGPTLDGVLIDAFGWRLPFVPV